MNNQDKSIVQGITNDAATSSSEGCGDKPSLKRTRDDAAPIAEKNPSLDKDPSKKSVNDAKMRRILSNREHARASYLRKKKLIEDLKKSVSALEEENKRLREENISLKASQTIHPMDYASMSLQAPQLPYPMACSSGPVSSLSETRRALLESLSGATPPSLLGSQQSLRMPLVPDPSWLLEAAARAPRGVVDIPMGAAEFQHRAALLGIGDQMYRNPTPLQGTHFAMGRHHLPPGAISHQTLEPVQGGEGLLNDEVRRVSSDC